MVRLLACLLLICAAPACAWNAGAHRLIAHIAWQQLSPAAIGQIGLLLQRHPDYRRWTKDTDNTNRLWIAFLEASNWPDDIRQDDRFYDEFSGPPTPAIAGLPDTLRHRNWHYTDRQIDGSPREGTGQLDTQLGVLIWKLRHASRQEKVYALPWVLHLIGDAHQPLHVASKHDKGGNLTVIEDPVFAEVPQTNLHRWWDHLPAPVGLRGKALEQRTGRLLARHPPPATLGDPELWLRESFDLARRHAYPPNPMISQDFRTRSKTMAERRLVHAGYRLGALLQDIFGTVPADAGSE